MTVDLLPHYINLKEIAKRAAILMNQFCRDLFVEPVDLVKAMLRTIDSILYKISLFGVRGGITT